MAEYRTRTIVLKFGGSVLTDTERYGQAVHEIYRWSRAGWRVVAVVSALAGETDALIDQVDQLVPDADPWTRAAWLGQGESRSASLLGLLLDRSGIPARVLAPGAIGLVDTGNLGTGCRLRIDPTLIKRGLDADGVVVVPGFIAIDQEGRSVTLGRGGSDTTAVLIAGAIRADKCRLIKDVDGLYESDPSKDTAPPPARFRRAHYTDALATDGTIIQHESVRLAQSLGVSIELGRINGRSPSVIGAEHAQLDQRPDSPHRLRVAICGLGTVGGGVVGALSTMPGLFEIVGGASRSPAKHEALRDVVGTLTHDPVSLTRGDADVIVELIGGVEVPYEVVCAALRNGKHVVTANKALIAEHGHELKQIAELHGAKLLFAASVGGSLPVLERLTSLRPESITGVLNGTSQFVLNAIARGERFEDAVLQAQRLGYAESDPSRDLDGRDALDKLRVIALQLGWDHAKCASPNCNPKLFEPGSGFVRQIARLTRDDARVEIESVESDSGYRDLNDSENLVTIRCTDQNSVVLRGRGAGRWATTVSVVGDLLELSRAATEVNLPSPEGVCDAAVAR